MLRTSGAIASCLLLTSIVYAAPRSAADTGVCDASVAVRETAGFSPLVDPPASVSPLSGDDGAFRHSATLTDDDHDPVQQDDAPPLGLPRAQAFDWSLERLGTAAILIDLPSAERACTQWSPRGPPLHTMPSL